MISKLSILLLLLLGRFFIFYNGESDHQPLIAIDGWDLSSVSIEEPAFTMKDDSTLVEYNIVVLEDAGKLPIAYTSNILTPVCDDSLCALMNIQMYWNLLGNYIGYDTIAGDPLTKNDHIKFDSEDYVKLHNLLKDDNSIIKRKEKKELFDDEAKRVSHVVDAVTGATAKEVKEAVVDGALYSCYTIYHIVYGRLSDSIRSNMESRYSVALQEQLLTSEHSDYQLYALKRLNTADFITYQNRIIELIHEAIPLIRLYIMKKMPEEMWHDEVVYENISDFFDDLDGNTMTYFLREMESRDGITTTVILDIVNSMERLSQNQLKILIRLLQKNTLNEEVLTSVKRELENPELIHGYLFDEFLSEISEKGTIEN